MSNSDNLSECVKSAFPICQREFRRCIPLYRSDVLQAILLSSLLSEASGVYPETKPSHISMVSREAEPVKRTRVRAAHNEAIQPLLTRMDEQHDSQRIQFDDQATKLAERRKFWIDMNFDSFVKLCRQQKLLSSLDGSQEPRNECYEMALTLYRIVHNQQSGPAELVLSYLKRLEDLRNANILVSADRFLKED